MPLLVMAGMFKTPPLLVTADPLAMTSPVAVTDPPLTTSAEELATEMLLATESVPPLTASCEFAASLFRPTLTDLVLTVAVPEMVTSPLPRLPALRSPVRVAVPPLKVASPLAPQPTFKLCSWVVPAFRVPPDMLK